MSKILKIKLPRGTYWFDINECKAQAKFIEEKEKEYWNYCLSGQRTIDIFGIEGAKRVLEEQRKRDQGE